jgi:hypothetical protein
MADRSEFSVSLSAVQVAPSPYGQQVSARKNHRQTLLPGDNDNEFSVLFSSEFTLAASGTQTLDLKLDEDRFGDALALADVALLYVENVDDPAGGGTIEVRPGAANGIQTLFGPGSAIIMGPGMTMMLWNWLAGSIPVQVTKKTIDVVETGAIDDAVVRVQAWGRR